MEMHRHGCAVLAGGAGRRMGWVDKGGLSLGEETFLDHICREMEKTGLRGYLSTARYEQPPRKGWTSCPDSVRGRDGDFAGPMGGIVSCLRMAREDGLSGLFFAPCDTPNFHSALVERLRSYVEQRGTKNSVDEPGLEEGKGKPEGLVRAAGDERPSGENLDVVLWKTRDGRLQPTLGWYSVRCLPVLEKRLKEGNLRLMRALEELSVLTVEAAQEGIEEMAFFNCNSPEDYREVAGERGRGEEITHLLICGEKQVGKSALVDDCISRLGCPVYGFRTRALEPSLDGIRQVYLFPAGLCPGGGEADIRTAGNHVGDVRRKVLLVHPEVFDTLGVSLIREAKKDGILVMDELGYMEEQACAFQEAVMDALDGDIPVICMVKKRTEDGKESVLSGEGYQPGAEPRRGASFLDRVKAHPRTRLLEVTEENREEMIEEAYRHLCRMRHGPGESPPFERREGQE